MGAWALALALFSPLTAGEPARLEPLPETAAMPLSSPAPIALGIRPGADAIQPLEAAIPALVVAPLSAAPLQPANEPMLPANGDQAAGKPQASAERQSAQAARRFDNAYKPKGEVVAALGFDPVGMTGGLLSLPTKSDVRVLQVASPKTGAPVVFKVAPRAAVARELFVRNVIEATPELSKHFEVIPADAFRRRLLDPRGVLVMDRAALRRAPELSIARKAALAALAYGLGISDHNEDGVFVGKDGKTLINDFEKALTPLREDMRAGALSDPALHLSAHYINDYADYAPAVESWRSSLASRREDLRAMLLKSGMTGREAARTLSLLERNAELMEGQLKKDLARENASFLSRATAAGLTPRQVQALSGVNRAAHSGDPSMRDAVRRYIRARGKQAARWKLWPETGSNLTPAEWKDYLDSRADNKDSDRS